MGGNGLACLTQQIRNGSVTHSRILEVADVEPEYLSHAGKKCMAKQERMVGSDLNIQD